MCIDPHAGRQSRLRASGRVRAVANGRFGRSQSGEREAILLLLAKANVCASLPVLIVSDLFLNEVLIKTSFSSKKLYDGSFETKHRPSRLA